MEEGDQQINYMHILNAIVQKRLDRQKAKSCSELIINSLWPRNAIRRHRSGSTLAQGMAWYPEPMLADHQ